MAGCWGGDWRFRGGAFLRAWLEPLPSLRYVQGLKAHADPPGAFLLVQRCAPNASLMLAKAVLRNGSRTNPLRGEWEPLVVVL
ncbi:hypothetical protein CSV67_07825 [Sporosarcina sp. P2]|nr:hypothetical protein CSV67_07825 [Sporosarcina sp. P2]